MGIPKEMLLLTSGPSFSQEQLCDVSPASDFIRYVEADLGYDLFWENNVELFIGLVNESGLINAAHRVLGSGASIEPMIVQVLKYAFVFRLALNGLSSEDDANVLGLPHAFEACDDLECAMKLAADGHYKQSLQTLRSALELSVCHAYFSVAGLHYEELEATIVPPLKDRRRGMINRLLSCRRITTQAAEEIASTYSELSHATHSNYRYLNSKFEEEDEGTKLLCFLSNLCVVSHLCTQTVLGAKGISLYTGTSFQ